MVSLGKQDLGVLLFQLEIRNDIRLSEDGDEAGVLKGDGVRLDIGQNANVSSQPRSDR